VPDGEAIEFIDRNLGPQRYVAGRDFGDFVVWRRDGVPSYQLPAWPMTPPWASPKSSARRPAQIDCATDPAQPRFGLSRSGLVHCHLVVDHNGRRLAKRHDSLSLRSLRQRGLTPMKILSADLPVEE